jgi:uncharacterized protein
MMPDDLSAPLGQDGRSKRQRAFPVSVSRTVVAALGLLALIFAAWALIADDPFGGEPVAIVPAASLPATDPGSRPAQVIADPQPPLAPSGNSHDSQGADFPAAAAAANRTVTIIDGTSGKRQEVVIPGTADFAGIDRQPAGNMRRGGAAKAAPQPRVPSSPTPAR